MWKPFIFLPFFIIVLSSLHCLSQTKFWIEYESKFSFNPDIVYKPKVSLLLSKNTKSSIGFYAYALVTNSWAQSYTGVIINIRNSQLNLGVGLEQDKNPLRFNLAYQLKKNKFSLSQNYEYGGSGFWYNFKLDYSPNDIITLGLFARRYYGIGPRFELFLFKRSLSLWTSPLYDIEFKKYNAILCIKYYVND
jgi:hypothetical protein